MHRRDFKMKKLLLLCLAVAAAMLPMAAHAEAGNGSVPAEET